MAVNPWTKHPLQPKQIKGYVTKSGGIVTPHEHDYPHAEKPQKATTTPKKKVEEPVERERLRPKKEVGTEKKPHEEVGTEKKPHEEVGTEKKPHEEVDAEKKPSAELVPKKEKALSKGSEEVKDNLACALGV
jgi:hypothetical protein